MGQRERRLERENLKKILFLLFAFFSDLRKSERGFSSRLKAKLIYETRATRGHQNLRVSTKSVR